MRAIVELNLYDGEEPVAVIGDDGHGMNRSEFVGKWLVVGTESKATTERTPIEDRNGLYLRPRLGQKWPVMREPRSHPSARFQAIA
jgi:hypothetical protein